MTLPVSHGLRTLTLSGLRLHASLGVLPHEMDQPQPISVDAELHLGSHPLVDDRSDAAPSQARAVMHHVLDYRRVRLRIIQTCTAEHVLLLESLAGKLCAGLMAFEGVCGVRVKVAKLAVFDDCEVAITMQSGRLASGEW